MLSFLRELAVEQLGHLEANFILGGEFKYFLFLTLAGEMIHFDKHIFRMG